MYIQQVTLGRWKHTAEPLVPKPSPFQVEIAITNLKRYKYPGTDKSPSKIREGSEKLCSNIHDSLILLGIRKNSLSSGIVHYVTIYNKGDKTDHSNVHCQGAASDGFLLSTFFDPDDGGNMFI
jgi:hypothetical protein